MHVDPTALPQNSWLPVSPTEQVRAVSIVNSRNSGVEGSTPELHASLAPKSETRTSSLTGIK